ncbi:MAG: helix-turn-helix domain-containing protein [Thermoguttaceae bacterium]
MLGEEIRKARLKAGLTQERLAFKAGVSRQYVSVLELNEKSPTVDTLIRVCRAMGASAGKIVARVEKAS